MAKKVTMQQIAEQLGVSKFVVSKALSGKPGVSAITRERVIQTAAQLGYVMAGQTLRATGEPAAGGDKGGGKSSVIVLMPNIRFQTRDNAYWGRILEGITGELARRNLGMVIINEQTDKLLDMLNLSGFLGMIGVGLIPTDTLLQVQRLGMPLVLIDHDDPLIAADAVFTNNYDGTVRLVNYLLALGHSRMKFVGDTSFSRSFMERWTGFRATLEQRLGHAVVRERDLFAIDGGDIGKRESLQAWLLAELRLEEPPTCFVCANDHIALTVMTMLERHGVQVPHDVSVVGYDNIEAAHACKPGLTTVNVPKEILGRKAVEMLLQRADRPVDPLYKTLVSGEFIIRESVGKADGARVKK